MVSTFLRVTSGSPEVLQKYANENHSLHGSRVIQCQNEVRIRIEHYELPQKLYQYEFKRLFESK